MRRHLVTLAGVLAAAALVAGCGSDGPATSDPAESKPRSARVGKAEFADRLDAACRRAQRRWDAPLAAARRLGPSPIQTSAPRAARRAADKLRGYRAVLQDVIDTAGRKPRPKAGEKLRRRYELELSKAASELEGDELKLRQQWDRQSQAPVIRRNLRLARGFARRYGARTCASLDTRPY